MSNKEAIIQKISNKTLTVGVIGLGYVGLPLAVCFAAKQVQVLGFDTSSERVKKINSGNNYIADVNDEKLATLVQQHQLSATSDF